MLKVKLNCGFNFLKNSEQIYKKNIKPIILLFKHHKNPRYKFYCYSNLDEEIKTERLKPNVQGTRLVSGSHVT